MDTFSSDKILQAVTSTDLTKNQFNKILGGFNFARRDFLLNMINGENIYITFKVFEKSLFKCLFKTRFRRKAGAKLSKTVIVL